MLMDLTSYKIVENLIKMAEKLSRYHVFIVLEKPTFPSAHFSVQQFSLTQRHLERVIW